MTPPHPTRKHLLKYENKWFTWVTWLLQINRNDSLPCHEQSFAKGSTHAKSYASEMVLVLVFLMVIPLNSYDHDSDGAAADHDGDDDYMMKMTT